MSEKGREAFTKLALDNPDALKGDQVIAIPEVINTMVDAIVKKARKYNVKGRVESEKHWEIVQNLVKIWEILYEQEANHFYKEMKKRKAMQQNKFASAKEGEAEIRHLLEIPNKLMSLIRTIFDDLQADKDFMREFAKRFPQFRVADKI